MENFIFCFANGAFIRLANMKLIWSRHFWINLENYLEEPFFERTEIYFNSQKNSRACVVVSYYLQNFIIKG